MHQDLGQPSLCAATTAGQHPRTGYIRVPTTSTTQTVLTLVSQVGTFCRGPGRRVLLGAPRGGPLAAWRGAGRLRTRPCPGGHRQWAVCSLLGHLRSSARVRRWRLQKAGVLRLATAMQPAAWSVWPTVHGERRVCLHTSGALTAAALSTLAALLGLLAPLGLDLGGPPAAAPLAPLPEPPCSPLPWLPSSGPACASVGGTGCWAACPALACCGWPGLGRCGRLGLCRLRRPGLGCGCRRGCPGAAGERLLWGGVAVLRGVVAAWLAAAAGARCGRWWAVLLWGRVLEARLLQGASQCSAPQAPPARACQVPWLSHAG